MHACRSTLEDPTSLHALDTATQCAMGWLAERVRFDAVAHAHPARVLRVDFDALLADRARQLSRIATFLGLDPAHLDAALNDAAWGRYAKADDHAYDIAARDHDLALSTRRNADAITAAIEWTRAQLASDPGLAAAVTRSVLDDVGERAPL